MSKTMSGTDCNYFICYGQRMLIDEMFDENGEETTDPKKAISLVCILPNGWYLAADCSAGEIEASKLN